MTVPVAHAGLVPLQATDAIGRQLADRTPIGAATAETIAGVLVFAIVFVAIAALARSVVVPLVKRVLHRRGLDAHARKPIVKVVWFGLLFVAVAVAFGAGGFGNFLSSLAVIAAAATLAVGFAMQDVLKNFVAGVFVFTEQPFRIGDWIEWDEHAGVVEDVSLRVTRVRTFDNELLTVPNAELTDSVVKNPVANDRLRLKVDFGVGYDDDLDRAADVIVAEAERHPDILDDPAPSVRLTELGDSHVGLQARVWIANPSRSDFVNVRGEYVQAVKERFDAEGIDIPYPHRTLEGGVEIAGDADAVQ